MQELKEKLDQSKEEIGQIQSELQLFQQTTAVKRQHETTTAADSKPSFVFPERSPAVSLANEVQYNTNIQYSSLFTHVSSNELNCLFKICRYYNFCWLFSPLYFKFFNLNTTCSLTRFNSMQ